jgi:hypothetical protein
MTINRRGRRKSEQAGEDVYKEKNVKFKVIARFKREMEEGN